MSKRLPPVAYLLGVGGALPFIGCGIAAVSPGTNAAFGLAGLIGYAAIILSFVGAVHWGFALAPCQNDGSDFSVIDRSKPSMRTRLLLGIMPSLIGWCAVLIGLAMLPDVALVVLIAGFVATVVIEARWSKLGVVPAGYMGLRWGLSLIVIMTLVTVLALRLVGASIVF